MTDQAKPAVQLTGVTKAFGDVIAVDHIDLTIQDGESIPMLDDELNAFLTNPNVLVGGEGILESILNTRESETNDADAFSRAKG